MRIAIKGINRVLGRDGKLRLYHRKTGTPLKSDPRNARALAAEIEAIEAGRPKAAEPVARTWGNLCLSGLIQMERAEPAHPARL